MGLKGGGCVAVGAVVIGITGCWFGEKPIGATWDGVDGFCHGCGGRFAGESGGGVDATPVAILFEGGRGCGGKAMGFC